MAGQRQEDKDGEKLAKWFAIAAIILFIIIWLQDRQYRPLTRVLDGAARVWMNR